MRKLPILMSTPMVKAILNGNKTVTRRTNGLDSLNVIPETWKFAGKLFDSEPHVHVFESDVPHLEKYARAQCPYGQVGDLLWVREEHLITFSKKQDEVYVEYKDGTEFPWHEEEISSKTWEKLKKRKTIGKWQRARFLPKELSRIWLQVTDIKVERLEDITEQGAIAEGVESKNGLYKNYYKPLGIDEADYKEEQAKISFHSLWFSINGPDSWAANPWVWVVKFKVLSTTGKPQTL